MLPTLFTRSHFSPVDARIMFTFSARFFNIYTEPSKTIITNTLIILESITLKEERKTTKTSLVTQEPSSVRTCCLR